LTLWPFALTSGIVAVYYRISGILMERITDIGEVLIAEGDKIEESNISDPACTTYDACEQFNKAVT